MERSDCLREEHSSCCRIRATALEFLRQFVMRISRKSAYIGALAVLGIFSFYVWWSLEHMKIDLPLEAFFRAVLPHAAVVGAALRANANCLAADDSSSIGNREKEAEMYFVAKMPSLYKERFGGSPSNISDLRRLPEFDRPDSLNGHAFLRDCSIYSDPGGSFAVSCGQSRSPVKDVAAFMKNAPPVQKFVMLGKGEILYVPAPKC